MNKNTGILMLLIYICVATALLTDKFVGAYNVQNTLRWTGMFGILGIGMAFVIITGGIDLSIGSMIGLVGCLLPMLLVQYGWSIPAALAAVMLVSLGLGLFHGLLITKVRLQPFIVTLCGLLYYRGLARWLTGDQTQGFGVGFETSLRPLATGKPCSIELVLLVAGLLVAAWHAWKLFDALRSNSVEGPTKGSRESFAGTAHGVLRTKDSRPLFVPSPTESLGGIVAGVVLAVVGSSRYWHADGPIMPGRLMWWIGVLSIPSGLWFAGLALRKNPGKMLTPLVSLVASSGFLALAIWIGTQPDDWFWLGETWASRWRMTAVSLSLGTIMAALAWFGRRGLDLAGASARMPAMLTAFTAILWLVGQYYLTSAAVSRERGESFQSILVPMPFFVMVALAVVASIFLNQTIYGRYLLALGRNQQAARFSGINTDRMIILAYVICAGASGLGGILFALDGNSIQPSGHGNSYELYAIAAAVLGGCSLRGGEGSILGVIIGSAVMRVLNNSINLLGIPSQLEFAIIGLVILLGVIADEVVKRVAARQRAAERSDQTH